MVSKPLIWLSILTLALTSNSPADALSTLVVPEYGKRGPLDICEGNIGIRVGDDEAVHVVGNVLRIINDRYLIAAVPSALPLHAVPAMLAKPVPVNSDLMAYRYTGPSPDGAKAVPQALEDHAIRYLVISKAQPITVLIVGASLFSGANSDRAILSRLRAVPADDKSCIRPLNFAPWSTEHKQAGFEGYAQAQAIALYPPKPDAGPSYYCMGSVGFRVEPGEKLLRPWRSLGYGLSYLMRDGVTVKISGPQRPMQRVDPQDMTEHPMSPLHESRVTFSKSRGVGPPYAAPGVREDGSWSVELGKERNSRMEISFPAFDKTPIGFRFLERLEFVDEGDPRCGKVLIGQK